MKLLQEAIEQRGKIINDDVLKVDSFMNHQIDCELMEAIGKEFAEYFKDRGITKVVTIESSGIAPAVFTGKEMGVPVVFLKKSEPSTMTNPVFTEGFSFTKNKKYTLCMEKDYIKENEHVLFIDDFLANGQSFISMESLVAQCGGILEGVGIVIEKSFQKGRKIIEEKGYDIHSLARIGGMKDNKIFWAE